jgi:hypothetical protein
VTSPLGALANHDSYCAMAEWLFESRPRRGNPLILWLKTTTTTSVGAVSESSGN